jgi:hypothetical protein
MSTIPGRPPPDSRSAAPPQPDPYQQAQELAEAGDFGAALACFISSVQGGHSLHQLDALLRRSVASASQQSPQKFAHTVFAHNTVYLQYILLRLQACTLHCLAESDANSTQRRDELPLELTRNILPSVERLSRLLGEQLQTWASTNRLWKLAGRRKKLPCSKGDDGQSFDDPDDTLLDRS